MTPELAARARAILDRRSIPEPTTGCVLWLGALNKGHGRLRFGDGWAYAHVLAWTLEYGPVPAGMQLDHCRARGCASRACINPAHLEPVSSRENTLRGEGPSAANSRKDRCQCGSDYVLRSRRSQRIERICVQCRREQNRRRRQRVEKHR